MVTALQTSDRLRRRVVTNLRKFLNHPDPLGTTAVAIPANRIVTVPGGVADHPVGRATQGCSVAAITGEPCCCCRPSPPPYARELRPPPSYSPRDERGHK
ncbi:hypothetical protein NKR23_g11716 [Pleurostoma richardsiae]|uniref:Uncharacterized protein n=1 Tax=Pleurostoma richardsiae TaxID=41990 RepID=A0AA38VDD4_9PEZI|nr:hypothetical protein NKR23_g11716 [Pleurostoma richardsiae]